MDPARFFHKEFTLDGLGVSSDMAVDGSVTMQEFRVIVPPDQRLLVKQLKLHLGDITIEPDEFGGLNDPLTNGLKIHFHDVGGGYLFKLVDDIPITTNMEFEHLGAVEYMNTGTNQDVLRVTLDFAAVFGFMPQMRPLQYVAIHVRDDLSGLDHFEATLSGVTLG